MWHNITINSNCVKQSSTKAFLIKIPNEDWLFWIPAKLVNFNGKNAYKCNISINDDFKYNIFKNGKGKYNKFEKIEEETIKGADFKEMFGIEE